MNTVNQNTEMKQVNEQLIFTGEVENLDFAETERERLREEIASERDARLRLAAEYENYRRRTKRESEKTADEGKRELLTQLLAIADELELAAAHSGDATDTVAEGLRLVRRRFDAMLRANGVVAFKSEGEIFNPEIHEAFDVIHGTKAKPGTIHSEVRCGYFWNDGLLRAALVVVAQ